MSSFSSVQGDDWDCAKPIGDKLLRDVRQWISPPDPWKNHNLARESRHTGTGAWWIRGDAYAKWKSSGPNSLLWIHGKRLYSVAVFFPEIDYAVSPAGAGKSVIWYDNFSIL